MSRIFRITVSHSILIWGVLLMIVPLWLVFASSTHTNSYIYNEGMQWKIGGEFFENYDKVLNRKGGFTKEITASGIFYNSFIMDTKESLENIDSALPKLADPNSDQIEEPYKGQNPTRSKSSEYTVMVGVCTHLGCSPKYHPEVEPKPWDASWAGGFFCPCHGSMFDMVGRVYKGVPAPTNLPVPPHFFDGSILTIGEDGGTA
jgi:Rieske Fe-S protein